MIIMITIIYAPNPSFKNKNVDSTSRFPLRSIVWQNRAPEIPHEFKKTITLNALAFSEAHADTQPRMRRLVCTRRVGSLQTASHPQDQHTRKS